MKKKDQNNESTNDIVGEPVIEYEIQPESEIETLTPLMEEEWKNLLTGEELLERVIPRIRTFFE